MANLVESFSVTKRFSKLVKLPNMLAWKVTDEDVLVSGHVLSYIRSKGLVMDSITSLKKRMVTVTKQGFLVIYEKPEKGLVVDARMAANVLITTDVYKSRKTAFKKCHVKMKFHNGNIHFFLVGDQIAAWRDAIYAAHESTETQKSFPLQRNFSQAYVESKSFGQSQGRTTSPIFRVPALVAKRSSSDLDADMKSHSKLSAPDTTGEPSADNSTTESNSGAVTVADHVAPSVRQGQRSVQSLRRCLESKFEVGASEKVAVTLPQTSDTSSATQKEKEVPKASINGQSFSFFFSKPKALEGDENASTSIATSNRDAFVHQNPKQWVKSLRC